jgi:hypothetical protein
LVVDFLGFVEGIEAPKGQDTDFSRLFAGEGGNCALSKGKNAIEFISEGQNINESQGIAMDTQ